MMVHGCNESPVRGECRHTLFREPDLPTQRRTGLKGQPSPFDPVAKSTVAPNDLSYCRHPSLWGDTLSAKPVLDCRLKGRVPSIVRRWRDLPPTIDQSPLTHHYVSVHLGGPKRVHRSGEGRTLIRDIAKPAYSVIPAGSAYRWYTEGPVDFLHLYLPRGVVDHFVSAQFDRDPKTLSLIDALGADDPLLAQLVASLATELAETDGERQAYVDDLIHLLLFRLLKLHSNVAASLHLARHSLAPRKLQRAIDFIEANLARTVGVGDIADAASMSPFHFSRAFRAATGKSPYAFMVDRRIASAKRLLREGDAPLSEVASRCGFSSASQFSRRFRDVAGVTPRNFRDAG